MTLLDYYILTQRAPTPTVGPWYWFWRNRSYLEGLLHAPICPGL